MNHRISGYLFILLAATFWGTLGVFYKYLTTYSNLSPIEIVFWRALFAAFMTFIILLIWRRRDISIQRSSISLFLAIGIIGIAGFYISYIFAITAIGIGIASVLLYSAPIWVALFGFVFQGESMTLQKMLALILALAGIILIAGKQSLNQLSLGSFGLLAGLASGLGYAAYILFNKKASESGYSTWTVNAYGLGIGSLVLFIFQDFNSLSHTLSEPRTALILVLLGIVPTLGGGLAFYAGLQRIPAVNASIVATFEPVVAIALGWLVFSEKLGVNQIIGVGMILSAVILIQVPGKKFREVFSYSRAGKG
jgi:DME family drug/metabolite transporter